MKDQNTPTNTLDLIDQIFHIDSFRGREPIQITITGKLPMMDEHSRMLQIPYVTVQKAIDRLVSQAVNKAEVAMWEKTTKAMMDILQENFHYRLMCGEVRDPDGKIDVMQEFVKYQELEPERKKFSEYLEGLKLELNRDETPNQVEEDT